MGIVLLDHSGNGNNLTNVNATEVIASLPFTGCRKAVDCERDSSQYLYAADHASLDIIGDFTVEFWMKLESLYSDASVILTPLGKYDTGSNQRSWKVYIGGGDKITLQFSHDGTLSNYAQATVQTALNATDDKGVWVHWAFTVDVSAGKAGVLCYRNSSVVADDDSGVGTVTALFASSAPLIIGGAYDSGAQYQKFDGQLAEVRLWSDIRTPTEIGNYYNKHLPPAARENLVAYYPFHTLLMPKSVDGLAIASVKSINGLALDSVKSISGLT